MKVDWLIVGAGYTDSVLAERRESPSGWGKRFWWWNGGITSPAMCTTIMTITAF